MKIALCLSGQPRYIEEGYYFINKYLLNKYDIDVFIHTWWDDSFKNNEFNFTNIKRNSLYDEDAIIKLVKYYNPKKIIHEPQILFETFNNVNYESVNPISVFSMFYSIKQSNELKKSYEQENNFLYDLVIRCRLDIVFGRFNLKLENMDSNYMYVGGEHHYGNYPYYPNDHFCISSSENMDYYSNLYDKLEIYRNEGYNRFIGERLLKYHLIDKGNKQINFCQLNELLTTAWWQFSVNDCGFQSQVDTQNIFKEFKEFKEKL